MPIPMRCTLPSYQDMLQAVRAGHFAGRRIAGVTDRSFDVAPGWLFVALHGQHVDGVAYAQEAVARGAIAVVAEQPLSLPVPTIVVHDAAEALGHLAAGFSGDPCSRLRVVGITGTNGKTTTAALLSHALGGNDRHVGTLGTLGVQLDGELIRPLGLTTPPSPVLQAALQELEQRGAADVVMEVSSHALRQHRTAGCRFGVGVFTNWTRDHTDYHGDMQHYLEAKGLLFSGLSEQDSPAFAVLNQDSPAFSYLASVTRVPVRTFGQDGDVRLLRWQDQGLAGGSGDVLVDGDTYPLEVRLPGSYNVENALAALAAATGLDLRPSEVLRRIAEVRSVAGRLHIVEVQDPTRRVVIDYAHNPAGLLQLLRFARRTSTGKVIAVFGGRGERDRGKRPLMGAIAAALADRLIVTVDNPRGENALQTATEVAGGARESGIPTDIVLDRYEAIRRAVALAGPGDTITITGKGAEIWDEQHAGRSMTDIQAVEELLDLSQ